MRIKKLAIRGLRAFDKRVEFSLDDFTVLTGPNNLGKSTILHALRLFFGAMGRRPLLPRHGGYSYEHDYPKKYDNRRGRRWPTLINASIAFSDEDILSYQKIADNDLPRTLGLTVEFPLGEHGTWVRPKITSSDLPVKLLPEFIPWFEDRFQYVYIPVSRTVDDFKRTVFTELATGVIRNVRNQRRRLKSIEKFYEDVEDELSTVEERLATELQTFLPEVRSVKFILSEFDLFRLIALQDIEIDDGAQTPLAYKGDGFKSLFAISLLQYISRQRYGTHILFGVEEPESHLHSTAVYELKDALRSLSDSFQVIVTTHSPILIQRDSIRSNLIVESTDGEHFSSSVKSAKDLAQIRQSLGIKPQDNMTSAEAVLLVEGATEEQSLPAILTRVAPELERAFSSGRLRILSANSAANVNAMVRSLARDATSVVVLLDSDRAGESARDKLHDSGLIDPADLFLVPKRRGCQETEFEDIFDPALYIAAVAKACGISSDVAEFEQVRRRSGGKRTRMKKWSDVMCELLQLHGKEWDPLKAGAKQAFATAISTRVHEIPDEQLRWARSVAGRLATYLEQG